MDFVQRIVKDEPLKLAKRIHAVESDETLCGHSLNSRWYVVDGTIKDVTCLKCQQRCNSIEGNALV